MMRTHRGSSFGMWRENSENKFLPFPIYFESLTHDIIQLATKKKTDRLNISLSRRHVHSIYVKGMWYVLLVSPCVTYVIRFKRFISIKAIFASDNPGRIINMCVTYVTRSKDHNGNRKNARINIFSSNTSISLLSILNFKFFLTIQG